MLSAACLPVSSIVLDLDVVTYRAQIRAVASPSTMFRR